MSETKRFDPELHLLRSVARAIEGPGRSETEGARFNLWSSLSGGDHDAARRWAIALRVALQTYAPEATRAEALAAVERIEATMAEAGE
jgi:hypothetical protein